MRGVATSADPRARRSREQILDALHRSAREGTVTSMSALSVAAGVTRATIYNHFETLEEAAWFAMLDSFETLMAEDAAHRRSGVAPELVGVDSLRKVIEMLRRDEPLVRIADTYRSPSVLPGLAGILLETVQTFRADFAPPPEDPTQPTDAQDIYIAAGLYAVMVTGAHGQRDPGELAHEAYALLPHWMRHPAQPGRETDDTGEANAD